MKKKDLNPAKAPIDEEALAAKRAEIIELIEKTKDLKTLFRMWVVLKFGKVFIPHK